MLPYGISICPISLHWTYKFCLVPVQLLKTDAWMLGRDGLPKTGIRWNRYMISLIIKCQFYHLSFPDKWYCYQYFWHKFLRSWQQSCNSVTAILLLLSGADVGHHIVVCEELGAHSNWAMSTFSPARSLAPYCAQTRCIPWSWQSWKGCASAQYGCLCTSMDYTWHIKKMLKGLTTPLSQVATTKILWMQHNSSYTIKKKWKCEKYISKGWWSFSWWNKNCCLVGRDIQERCLHCLLHCSSDLMLL